MPTSLSWTVKPPAAIFINNQPPVSVVSNTAFAVAYAICDEDGNLLTSATNAVTVSILDNPVAGTLSGTLTVNAINGVATFSDLKIDKAGTPYTLEGNSTGLIGDQNCDGFSIVAAAPASIAKVSGDSQTAPLTAPFVVVVKDAFGNPVSGVTVTFAATTGGGSVTPTTDVTDASGLAQTMGTLGFGATVNDNTFTATATGLSGSPVTFLAPVLTPVSILMIRVPDAYYFDVYYTKPVVISEAEDEANYSVAPTLEVILVERLDDTSYRVHTSRQTEYVAYTVTITNVHDLDGLPLT